MNGIRSGDRVILAQAITLIESQLESDQELAAQLIDQCLPLSGKSIRVGMTGVPGVGKSSLIEKLGLHLCRDLNRSLAVLAIDPSSKQSHGSILADKTRMDQLTLEKNVFIRPSPSSGSLGGVAKRTRETIVICEAAGFDTILIETVGVGQSETQVHSMVDVFVLLMLAGAGDELQGIKRGIMELADILAITKADGNNLAAAKRAQNNYQNALHLFREKEDGWHTKVITCSAMNNEGIDGLWQEIVNYVSNSKQRSFFDNKRNQQKLFWLEEQLSQRINQLFFENPQVLESYEKLKTAVIKNEINTISAAKSLIQLFKNSR